MIVYIIRVAFTYNRPPVIRLSTIRLAIPGWIGEMSTGDCHDHCWGRNGEFCVTVDLGPVTSTVGTLT